jgi:hypothetical protein
MGVQKDKTEGIMRYRILAAVAARMVLACLAFPALLMHAHAGILVHKNVRDLVREADAVFIGSCLAVAPGSEQFADAGILGYTEYRFEVEEWIKGNPVPGRQIIFRQPRALPDRSLQGLAGSAVRILSYSLEVPSYVPGQRYLLFLHPANTWGLRSPVGLLQGAFRVEVEGDGGTSVVNGIENLGLFMDMDHEAADSGLRLSSAERRMLQQGKGPVDLQALLPLTRSLARRNLAR